MNMYNIEVLELSKNIIRGISNDLKNIKIKINTKAYNDLENVILKCNSEISRIDDLINENTLNNDYTLLKLERKILENLFYLKNRFNYETISKLLTSLIYNYEDMFVKDNIIEIKKIDSNKKMQLMLNNVDLYVCKTTEDEFGININDNIIYKIDDILIYDNREYLILKNLKKYPIGEEIFETVQSFVSMTDS